MPYLLFLTIAFVQWLVVTMLPVEPPFNPTTFFAGNIQIIAVMLFWQIINKYVKFVRSSDDKDSIPPIKW